MGENRVKWRDISKYRNEMYGLTILSIIVFHYFENVNGAEGASGLLKAIARRYDGMVGSVGVDIFLFLSGFCIFYSLEKRQTLSEFYRKRFCRVVVPYLVLGGIFWVLQEFVLSHESILDFLYNYSLLSFWWGGVKRFWYISLICCLYGISPFLHSRGRRGMLIASIAALVAAAGVYAASREVYFNIEIAIFRIPIYFLGMYCATLAQEDRAMHPMLFAILALSVPAKLLAGPCNFSFLRLLNTPYAIFLVLVYLTIRKRTREDGKGFAFLSRVGKHSLELYIVHVAVRALMGTAGLDMARPEIYGICMLISIPVGVGYSKLHKLVCMRRK